MMFILFMRKICPLRLFIIKLSSFQYIKQMQKQRRIDHDQFQKFKDEQFTRIKQQNNRHYYQQSAITSLNVYRPDNHQQFNTLMPLNSHFSAQYVESTQISKRDFSEKGSIFNKKLIENQREQFLINNQKFVKKGKTIRYNISGKKRTNTQSKEIDHSHEKQQKKDKIIALKKILQQYNTKAHQKDMYSNLNFIKPNFHPSPEQTINKFVMVNKLNPKISIKKQYNKKINNLIKMKEHLKLNQLQKYEQFYNYQCISLEAQGLNTLIKQFIENKKASKCINNYSMLKMGEKYKKVNNSGVNASNPKVIPHKFVRKNVSKNENHEIMRQIQYQYEHGTNMKINKYREFIFMINFTNKIYRELDILKYDRNFKAYIGNGNNNNLIKSIIKKRFWFQLTKNPMEANFIWTQLKQQKIYNKQIQMHCENEQKQQKEDQVQQNKRDIQQKQQQKDHIVIDLHATKKESNHLKKINQLRKMHKAQSLEQMIEGTKHRPTDQIFTESERQIGSYMQFHGNRNIKEIQSSILKKTKNSQNSLSVQNSIKTSLLHDIDSKSPSNMAAKDNSELNNSKLKPQIKNLKNRQKYPEFTVDHIRIFTKQQHKEYHQIIEEVMNKKKYKFSDRIKYLKEFKLIKQQNLTNHIIHNHLPINGLLGNKKAMFYMLKQYYHLTNKEISDILPLTFHIKKGQIDNQLKEFMNKYNSNKDQKKLNYWIIKPGQFSNRGQGITCSNNLQDIKSRINSIKKNQKNRSLILQEYITNPLLYCNRKFDIRAYMLITINNSQLRAYWYHDGYIRTSSYPWTLQAITDNLVHLTNDAIQKHSANYGKYEPGNKLNYSELQRYIDSLNKTGKPFNFQTDIFPIMKEIATNAIKSTFCFIDPARKGNNFEIFGFDFMIDNNYKPWLIEINTNPCLEVSCPVLQRIIPNMVQNAFRIAIDPIFPPPTNFSSIYKYNIPQNSLHYNKFQLIFDEEQDGQQLIELYKNNKIVQSIDEYEEDKQVYEQEGIQLNQQPA